MNLLVCCYPRAKEREMVRIVWLPVNQAWLVMFGDSRLAGPFNERWEAEQYLQEIVGRVTS